MLEIHKIKDNETIKQLANKAGIEYTDNNMFLASFVDEKIVEYLCYRKIDNNYVVLHISDDSDDFQIIFGLVKTLIFLADLAKIDAVSLPLHYERVAKAIGFTPNESLYELKLVDYQNKCGGCCN